MLAAILLAAVPALEPADLAGFSAETAVADPTRLWSAPTDSARLATHSEIYYQDIGHAYFSYIRRNAQFGIENLHYWKCNFPLNPHVRLSVGRSVACLSKYLLKDRKVQLSSLLSEH